MNLSVVLRAIGTILCAFVFLCILFTLGLGTRLELLIGFGGATLIGLGTLV